MEPFKWLMDPFCKVKLINYGIIQFGSGSDMGMDSWINVCSTIEFGMMQQYFWMSCILYANSHCCSTTDRECKNYKILWWWDLFISGSCEVSSPWTGWCLVYNAWFDVNVGMLEQWWWTNQVLQWLDMWSLHRSSLGVLSEWNDSSALLKHRRDSPWQFHCNDWKYIQQNWGGIC